jgi:hypothetical protein
MPLRNKDFMTERSTNQPLFACLSQDSSTQDISGTKKPLATLSGKLT